VIRVLLAALVVAAICWYFGADVWHSILFGLVLTTVGLVGSIGKSVPVHGDTGWRGGESRNRDGARNDVAELSWTLRTTYGRVGNTAIWRVQRLAQQRLAMSRLDLRESADRPRIEELIGRRAYVILAPSARRPPRVRSLVHCLDVLDTLDPARPARAALERRRWTSIFTSNLTRRARAR
jgi:hypothetical protein